MADFTLGKPRNGVVEIAGPERFRLAALVERYMKAIGDTRRVVADAKEPYFGAVLEEDTLLPSGADPRLGAVGFEAWLARSR